MNRKILLLSSSVPPALNAVAAVVGHLARQFSRDEMILLGSSDEDAPAERWDAAWPAVEYIRDPSRSARRAKRFLRKLVFPALYRRGLRLARVHGCTDVLAVFPFEEHLLAGMLIARAHGGRFFPYLHNTYLEQRAGFFGWVARRLQPRLFAAAAHVFVMSDGMLDHYRKNYPDLEGRISPLYHPFDGDLPSGPPPPAGTPPHFVMLGSVNPSNEDAAARLFQAVLDLPGSRLTLVGKEGDDVRRRLALPGDRVGAIQVPRDQLMAQLQLADVLLLPHGLTGPWPAVEYQTMFPTKTIEYLFSGRPILAHTPPRCFVTDFLVRNDCAMVVDNPDSAALRRAAANLLADRGLRARLVANATRTAARFCAPSVAGHLRSVVASSAGGRENSTFGGGRREGAA